MLSLAKYPIPRIGSLSIDDEGSVDLTNRPLTMEVQQLESELGSPKDPEHSDSSPMMSIPHRKSTHPIVDSYVHDLLLLHDRRLAVQPNGGSDPEDAAYQAPAIVVMRSIWSHFLSLGRGPFFLTFTFESEQHLCRQYWNITAIVDLEWSCSPPVEMIHPPSWTTGEPADFISPDKYEILHTEFVQIFKETELEFHKSEDRDTMIHSILEDGLRRKTFWFSLALTKPTALCAVLYKRLLPGYMKLNEGDHTFSINVMPLYKPGAFEWMNRNLDDKKKNDKDFLAAYQHTSR
ncbi:hypothetical protein ANO11243_087410 [Dothideomycetidae sp. 11243]|nr:hypothetical protein ANO11243_087410 [fungal sp. No.11243]